MKILFLAPLLLLVSLFLDVRFTHAADYFIATTGSNANSGSTASPWKTLQHAADVMASGDSVTVQPGSYAGFMSVRAGTPANPITFRASGSGVILNSRNPTTVDIVNIENYSGSPHDYIVIDGFEITGSSRAGVRVINARGVVIINNDIHHNGGWGILTGYAPDVQIINNRAHDQAGGSAQHGIYVSNSNVAPDNPVIRGNIVYGNKQNGIQLNGDCGTTPTDGWIDGFIIENNVVYNNVWKGLSIISARNGTIQNNVIYNNGTGGGAGGIHIVEETGASCPMYTSDNVTVVNNTVVELNVAAIRITGGNNGIYFNNILISSTPWVNEYGGTQYHSTASSVEQSSSTGLFVNAAGNDYRLSAGSTARNHGIGSYQSRIAPLTDLDGNARPLESLYDSGAYEYGSATIKVPKAPGNVKVLPLKIGYPRQNLPTAP